MNLIKDGINLCASARIITEGNTKGPEKESLSFEDLQEIETDMLTDCGFTFVMRKKQTFNPLTKK